MSHHKNKRQRKEDSLNNSAETEIRLQMEGLEGELFEVKETLQNAIGNFEKVANENEYLKETMAEMGYKLNVAYARVNDLEQYSRRNSIRVFGLRDHDKRENMFATEALVIDLCKRKLGINIPVSDIDIAHRVGTFSAERDRAVIVKFVTRKARQAVLQNRKRLKGTPVTIAEDLTQHNLQLLQRAKGLNVVTQAWSWEGRVYAKDKGGNVVQVRHGQVLDENLFRQEKDQRDQRTSRVENRQADTRKASPSRSGTAAAAAASTASQSRDARSTSSQNSRSSPQNSRPSSQHSRPSSQNNRPPSQSRSRHLSRQSRLSSAASQSRSSRPGNTTSQREGKQNGGNHPPRQNQANHTDSRTGSNGPGKPGGKPIASSTPGKTKKK